MEADQSFKLIKLREPEPTEHPDERMHWTLADVRRLFPTGEFNPIPPELAPGH
jgi:hypothetical protein